MKVLNLPEQYDQTDEWLFIECLYLKKKEILNGWGISMSNQAQILCIYFTKYDWASFINSDRIDKQFRKKEISY